MGALLAVIVGTATTVSGFSSEVPSGLDPREQIIIEFEHTPFPSWKRRGHRTSPRDGPERKGETSPDGQPTRPPISPEEILPVKGMAPAARGRHTVAETEGTGSTGPGPRPGQGTVQAGPDPSASAEENTPALNGPDAQDASFAGVKSSGAEAPKGAADTSVPERRAPARRPEFQPLERVAPWNYVLHRR